MNRLNAAARCNARSQRNQKCHSQRVKSGDVASLMRKTAGLFKQWTDLTGPQQWSIGASLLGSIATIASYIAFGVPLTFYTIVVTTTIVIISDRIARYANENKTSDVMSRISLSDNDLRYIGSTSEGHTWIS